MPTSIRVGQIWQDKDKRTPNMVLVLAVNGGHALIGRPSRRVWVRIDRLRKHFRFIEEAPTAVGGVARGLTEEEAKEIDAAFYSGGTVIGRRRVDE